MITNIQPVDIPTKGDAVQFNITVYNYELGGSSVDFAWQIMDVNSNVLITGILTMISPDLDNWGTDDEYVIDWALNQLGFIKQ